jgi:hypothetical protein
MCRQRKENVEAWVCHFCKKMKAYREALETIASYEDNNNCCSYGCDTPGIAKKALKVD